MTGAHSWYKHLKLTRAHPFVFFLDPNAGRSFVHVSETESTFVDNTDQRQAFHYTWQTTASYRQKFGHWNCHQPYSPSFQVRVAGGVLDTADHGPLVHSPDTGWLPVPAGLVQAGTAAVNALMYGKRHDPSPGEGWDLVQESRIWNLFVPVPRPGGSHYQFERAREFEPVLHALPGPIADALRPLFALWASESYRRELTQIGSALSQLHAKAFAAKGVPFDTVMQQNDGDRVRRETDQAWERAESRRGERALIRPLVAALDVERERQIGAIVDAMNRLLALL